MSLLQKGLSKFSGRVPKVIGPTTHAVIDYAITGSFFVMGAMLWKRNKRAAVGSLACGSALAINSLFTDYPGGVRSEISYQNHGRIEAGIAGLTASVPRAMGFDDDPESRFFEIQAIAVTISAALTNFDHELSERRTVTAA